MDYYNGYLIDVNIYELSKLEEKILENACIMIDNRWSLRTLSKNVLKSKSQLHRDFKKLKNFSYEMYLCIHKLYKHNYNQFFR